MTEEELKVKFNYIQGIFNRCINHAYQIITDSIVAKSEYLNREQADELEQQEYIRTTDELAQLYIRYSILDDIQNFYSIPDFFWESGFYEALKPDEKENTFYSLLFHLIIPDTNRTIQSMMKNCLIFPQQLELLYWKDIQHTCEKERGQNADGNATAAGTGRTEADNKHRVSDKSRTPIAETENPFGSILNDKQIELIVDCINEVKMFNASVTVDDLKAILSCKPNAILRSNNNRYVAFLFRN